MAKLLVLLAVCALVQISTARDLAEALNVSIRDQLNLFDQFLKEPDSGKFANDLKKLIEITEGALKANTADEKQQILSAVSSKFSAEFNNWIGLKLEEAQVNEDIQGAIEFYSSLLTVNTEHEAEIKKTLSTLESISKETNLKQKVDNFVALDKGFSAKFEQFLKENALPNVNRRLQSTTEFFENLLNDKDIKFRKEIQALKTKTEAALDNSVSIDDKSKVLKEITFTGNSELDEYLQKKNIELS